jgi:ribonuclease-3
MLNLKNLKLCLDEFESEIKYVFTNKENAILALTHSSYANENKTDRLKSNERLEFLGDAILNIAISEKIYFNKSELAEGEMTKVRAMVVCESSLMKHAENIKLGKYLLLGKGEELTGGRSRASILSDAFESVIGAIYLDGGMESAKEFIYLEMNQLLEDSINGTIQLDYKTKLQEIVQRNSESKIVYEIINEKGPDHDKVFVSQIKVNDLVIGVGEGKSKKEAEQQAAKEAMKKI